MGKRNIKRKKELVFNEEKRKEFLTGFSKRKQQRKKKAAEEFKKKVKEEQKRINAEAKDFTKKLKVSFQPIEELKDLLEDDEDNEKEEYETEDVIVSISTLDTEKIARKRNFIGVRPLNYQNKEESSESEEEDTTNKIPGMESDEENRVTNKPAIDPEILGIQDKIKSEKDIKRFIKNKAKQTLKKSKIMKTRDHLQKKRSKKLSSRKKHFQEKFLKKHKKIPKKSSK